MKKKKAPITTDDLAAMVQRGFEDATQDLADFKKDVNHRFAEMARRFDGLDQRLSAINNRLDVFADHPRRLDRLEQKVTKLEHHLN